MVYDSLHLLLLISTVARGNGINNCDRPVKDTASERGRVHVAEGKPRNMHTISEVRAMLVNLGYHRLDHTRALKPVSFT